MAIPDYCTSPQLVLATSTDGITWTDVKTLVTANYLGQPNNHNPHLWHNPNNDQFYLYWYNGNNSNVFNIMTRSASSPEGLDNAAGETTILTSTTVLAAPNMLYYNGTYFLSTEIIDNQGEWAIVVHGSQTSPTTGFSVLPNNPVLASGSACMFQHIFGTTLHVYYCKIDGGVWRVDHRSAPLSTQFRPSSAKWTVSGGAWQTVSAPSRPAPLDGWLRGAPQAGKFCTRHSAAPITCWKSSASRWREMSGGSDSGCRIPTISIPPISTKIWTAALICIPTPGSAMTAVCRPRCWATPPPEPWTATFGTS
jgi:hypothetical protein